MKLAMTTHDNWVEPNSGFLMFVALSHKVLKSTNLFFILQTNRNGITNQISLNVHDSKSVNPQPIFA
jgi:hypothetical protein